MYTPIDIKRNSKYGNDYWETYSVKIKRNTSFFSSLEYDNWVLIETNPSIKAFCEQPLKIQSLYEGKIVESIFDMWVQYEDNSEEFIEVKYSKELDPQNPKSKRSIRQTTVQKLWCNENGFSHRINTEKEIRGNSIYLSNMKQLLSFIKTRAYSIDIDKQLVFNILKKRKCSIQNIIDECTPLSSERTLEAICWLIYSGYAQANLYDRYLDSKTEVWINAEYEVY